MCTIQPRSTRGSCGRESVKHRANGDGRPLDLDQERAKLAAADRALKEQTLRERSGELIDASWVRTTARTLCATARERFEVLPDRLAAILAAESDERRDLRSDGERDPRGAGRVCRRFDREVWRSKVIPQETKMHKPPDDFTQSQSPRLLMQRAVVSLPTRYRRHGCPCWRRLWTEIEPHLKKGGHSCRVHVRVHAHRGRVGRPDQLALLAGIGQRRGRRPGRTEAANGKPDTASVIRVCRAFSHHAFETSRRREVVLQDFSACPPC